MIADIQPALTMLGLAFDFSGFCLLLREWWIAFFSEHAQMAYEENLERQQRMRAFQAQLANDSMKRHLATTGQMQDDMAINTMRQERRAALSTRRRWFIAATVLIVLGFLFQLAGAVPL